MGKYVLYFELSEMGVEYGSVCDRRVMGKMNKKTLLVFR